LTDPHDVAYISEKRKECINLELLKQKEAIFLKDFNNIFKVEMTYLKSLLINFLTVFFANYLLPGIEMTRHTKLPHVEGALIFAAAVGLVNSLIVPFLSFLKIPPSHFKIGLTSFVISFGAYALVNLLPLGIKVESAKGFFWAAGVVWAVSFFTNYLAFRKHLKALEDKLARQEDAEKKESPK